MKVVLFCGGLGMRLRDYAENVPKPMLPLGYRPIIWHLMKYYAHFGHRDFVLWLGVFMASLPAFGHAGPVETTSSSSGSGVPTIVDSVAAHSWVA